MNPILKRIYRFLLKPFSENLELLIILTLLSGAADGYFWTLHSFNRAEISPFFGSYMFLHSFLLTYGIVLICGFLRGLIFHITKILLYILGFLNLCIDAAIHIIMQCGFIKDFVAIIMGTNMNESREFIGMYINSKMISFVLVVSIVCYITHILFNKRHVKISNYVANAGLIMAFAVSLVVIAKKSENWDGVFLMKIKTCLSYNATADLREYRKKYVLENTGTLPKNFVLIIGESLNKSHMSLYGYEKQTTPLMDKLRNTGNLFAFDNVKASEIGTVPAFMFMMTSLTRDKQEIDWNKEDFMLDIVKSAGYNIRWISNQAASGLHDNVVARLAQLSDSVVWCGTKYMGPSKVDLDEVVLKPTRERSKDQDTPTFTVVHLCGNHENFRSRYSKKYERFMPQDYLTKKDTQRQILSEYDNSVLYNDWIVTSIINMYENQDAIVLYLPDHSLDIFDSSDDYAGHARGHDPKSVQAGKNIPFIIYTSPKYAELHPGMKEHLTESLHNDFETEDLIFSIMNLMGVDFSGDKSGMAQQRSILSIH